MAVSLAKVADVDRALGNESAACEGFQEAVKKLEGLSMPKNSENSALAKRVMSSFKNFRSPCLSSLPLLCLVLFNF